MPNSPSRQARPPRSACSLRTASEQRPGEERMPAPSDVNDRGNAGIRVLCVDDHDVLVEGLRAKFGVENRIRIVGSLGSVERLLRETTRLRPDIVLLDIELPGPDVFEMADRLGREHPGLRFIFLSAHIRDGYLAAAYKCGAWGYLAKGDELDDIVAGIVEVARSTGGASSWDPRSGPIAGR